VLLGIYTHITGSGVSPSIPSVKTCPDSGKISESMATSLGDRLKSRGSFTSRLYGRVLVRHIRGQLLCPPT
jgi:hypothetical protein